MRKKEVNHMAAKTLIALVAAFWTLPALAGVEALFGNELGLWENHSVVYAEVVSVSIVKRGDARVTLAVKATLTGLLDAAEQPRLEVDLTYGIFVSAVRELPKPKSRVVVVLMRWPNGRYMIENAFLQSMPDKAAILEVKSFEDPKVEQIVARLRELRAPKAALETKEPKGK